MKIDLTWTDYEIIATGNGMKLERWGDYILLRPDPQIIWPSSIDMYKYKGLSAVYERSKDGGGRWNYLKPVKDEFKISWNNLKFSLKLMGFKHTGLFPEQSINWNLIIDLIKNAKREINVLNLFAYTGGATLACMSAGAKVCHVDAAKAIIERAQNNVKINNLEKTNVRYIIDDCTKFVKREAKRGKKYDVVIMDPPSFGRGPNNELWKLEDSLYSLVELTSQVLSDTPLFHLISSYTTGLQPGVLKCIQQLVFKNFKKTEFDAYELGILTNEKIVLPCGASGLAVF